MDRKILRGFLILFWVGVLAFFQPPHGEAGIFGGYIPEGQEVKDSFLEKLFEPEYPYEWIRIIDTKEGKRFVIIKARQKITEETEKVYQEKTLRGRNIAIYRYHSPRTGNLILAKIRLSQKVSDRPYVIEYCQANPWKMQDKEKDIAWREGKYFIVWIDRNFGKKFKKLVIYPEKEEDCPPAPQVGKYLNSLAVGCSKEPLYPPEKGKSRIVFTYVTKDDPRRVYDFYKDRLIKNLEKMGINYPEVIWSMFAPSDRLGMKIDSADIEIVDKILSVGKGRIETLPEGKVFHIMIFKGVYAELLIKEYSWIRIYYEIEPEDIKEKVDKFGKKREK